MARPGRLFTAKETQSLLKSTGFSANGQISKGLCSPGSGFLRSRVQTGKINDSLAWDEVSFWQEKGIGGRAILPIFPAGHWILPPV